MPLTWDLSETKLFQKKWRKTAPQIPALVVAAISFNAGVDRGERDSGGLFGLSSIVLREAVRGES